MKPELPGPMEPRGRPVGHGVCVSRPAYRRRLMVATLVFALGVGVIVALVSAFILRDLSESYVSRVITQAKGEAEAFAASVEDPSLSGPGDAREGLRGGHDQAIDPDGVLPPRLPEMTDEKGQPVHPEDDSPLLGSNKPELVPGGSLEPTSGKTPGFLETGGQESRYFINGELIGRDAIQYIDIRYPGGHKRHMVRTIDQKNFDAALLKDPNTVYSIVPVNYPLNTRRVTITWDGNLNGQKVQFQEALDARVIDEGVAALRHRIVPKVLLGGGLFVVLLAGAYAFVFRLVGEARRLEAEANQQALLAQVGMMAAGLAHEIRNPLSAVNMNLQLLEEDLADHESGPPPVAAAGEPLTNPGVTEHLALLRSAQREIRRLGTLVSDFLAYARPAEPKRAQHSLDAIVRDCVELFRPMASGADIVLEASLGLGDTTIRIDEAMIKQALMNVILNAIQVVPRPGGRIRVTTSAAPRVWRVEVADNGPGLQGDVESMFRVFHSTKKGGSGLGLAISRAAVERHGGTLSARNGDAGGAVFTMTLPQEAAA